MTPITRGSCNHGTWLEVTSNQGNGFELLVTRRPRQLMNQVSLPNQRYPRLMVLLGRQSRASAIRSLWPSAFLPNFRRSGLQMHLDPHSAFGEAPPLILAQGDLQAGSTQAQELCHCQRADHVIVPHQETPEEKRLPITPHAVVCARILSLFAEVVCVFLSDYQDLDTVVAELASWMKSGSASTIPYNARPRLVLVTEMASTLTVANIAVRLSQVSEMPISTMFSAVSVVPLYPKHAISDTARYRKLKEGLLDAADAVRLARIDTKYLFTFCHFVGLLDLAVQHLQKTMKKPLNIVQSSRQHRPVSSTLGESLAEFLTQYGEQATVNNETLSIIASSLLADHYVPGMHRKLTRSR